MIMTGAKVKQIENKARKIMRLEGSAKLKQIPKINILYYYIYHKYVKKITLL